LKYTGLRRLLGSAIELSFAMNSGAGGWGITPNLTYYPTVDPKTAPAFRILGSLERSLSFVMLSGRVGSEKNFPLPQWDKIVALALAKILRLFQARKASPFSIDTANQVLTHVVARCVSIA
jgi:hypothetical protein